MYFLYSNHLDDADTVSITEKRRTIFRICSSRQKFKLDLSSHPSYNKTIKARSIEPSILPGQSMIPEDTTTTERTLQCHNTTTKTRKLAKRPTAVAMMKESSTKHTSPR